MAKVKSKKRKMNQDFKNEVPSEVSYRTASLKKRFSIVFQSQPLSVQEGQIFPQLNDYGSTSLQPYSYDNFDYFTGEGPW